MFPSVESNCLLLVFYPGFGNPYPLCQRLAALRLLFVLVDNTRKCMSYSRLKFVGHDMSKL